MNAINELAAALAKAQGEMQEAELDKENTHFQSDYSSLAAAWRACRKPLSNHGLSVVQAVESVEGKLGLRTTLFHSSGQMISSFLPFLGQIQDMQRLGSAITYARRYSLMAMVGVASEEDDDGEAATGRNEPPRAPAPQSKPAPKQDPNLVSQAQIKLLMASASGVGMPEDVLKEIVGRHGFTSRSLITKAAFESILKEVQGWLA